MSKWVTGYMVLPIVSTKGYSFQNLIKIGSATLFTLSYGSSGGEQSGLELKAAFSDIGSQQAPHTELDK